MTSVVIAMFVILILGVVTVGLVAVGLKGRWAHHVPRLASPVTQAARHLSGEAPAPDGFVRLVEYPFSR